MTRYTRTGDSIQIMERQPYPLIGYSLSYPKRVPRQVRALFSEIPVCGHVEVLWDRKTKTASRVSFWDLVKQ